MSENRSVHDMPTRAMLYHREASAMPVSSIPGQFPGQFPGYR